MLHKDLTNGGWANVHLEAANPQDESNEERGFGRGRPVEAIFLRSGSKGGLGSGI